MQSEFTLSHALFCAALLLVATIPVAGQTFSASLTGIVMDPNAAVIPGRRGHDHERRYSGHPLNVDGG